MKFELSWPFKLVRSIGEQTPGNTFKDKYIFLDEGDESTSGAKVDEGTACNFSAVWACNKVIAESVASLPLHIYERVGNNSEKAIDHPLYSVLHDSPNEFMTSFVFREMMQSYVNLWGNAYAIIIRDKEEQPKSFEVVHPSLVTPIKATQLWYHIEGYKSKINARDMIHVLSMPLNKENYFVGVSPVKQAREVIGNGLALQEFSNRYFGNGITPNAVLETDAIFKDNDSVERLRNGIEKKYSGLKKSHKPLILENGLKYKQISIEPEAAQFLESRKFAVEEIARWFRVPPHMIADLSKSSFSNIEQQSIDFVIHTLRPWLVRWEQELNRKLFSIEERKRYFVSYNIEGLLRGDAQARAQLYQVLFNTSSITPNEIRAKENMNPIEGGDDTFIQLNMTRTTDLGNEKDGNKIL